MGGWGRGMVLMGLLVVIPLPAHAELDCAGPDDPRTDVPECESLQTPIPQVELSQEQIVEIARNWANCKDHGGCQISTSWADEGWLVIVTPQKDAPPESLLIDNYGTILHSKAMPQENQ